jgi:hypothetical protein
MGTNCSCSTVPQGKISGSHYGEYEGGCLLVSRDVSDVLTASIIRAITFVEGCIFKNLQMCQIFITITPKVFTTVVA